MLHHNLLKIVNKSNGINLELSTISNPNNQFRALALRVQNEDWSIQVSTLDKETCFYPANVQSIHGAGANDPSSDTITVLDVNATRLTIYKPQACKASKGRAEMG